jgi:hypothetical protein
VESEAEANPVFCSVELTSMSSKAGFPAILCYVSSPFGPWRESMLHLLQLSPGLPWALLGTNKDLSKGPH